AFAVGRGVEAALADCRATAEAARAAGLGVNAGHDLDQRNLGPLLEAIPWIAEVSIGHALIGEALFDGLAATVRRYLAITGAGATPADRRGPLRPGGPHGAGKQQGRPGRPCRDRQAEPARPLSGVVEPDLADVGVLGLGHDL